MSARPARSTTRAAALSLCACALLLLAGAARARRASAEGGPAGFEYGSLEEIRNKRAMMLVVGRSFAVDARAPSEVSAEDVRSALETTRVRRSTSAYRLIGTKLNDYIRKYRSMSSVESQDEADFLIVFKIMQEHKSLAGGQPFSYGKMFVVVRGAGRDARPRVVWQSKGEMTLAEDAASALIKALKEMRGEK